MNIRITQRDHSGGNVDVSTLTLADWLDMNDPENQDVGDAAIALECGAERVELTDQATHFTVEAIR